MVVEADDHCGEGMVESLSEVKEMKYGILRMTENFCTPHNRENMPNQNAHLIFDLLPWRTTSLGLKRMLIR